MNDFRLDRGMITTVGGRQIVLEERDGTSVTIPLAPRARVVGAPGPGALRPGMRVLVVRRANAPANLIQVERGP